MNEMSLSDTVLITEMVRLHGSPLLILDCGVVREQYEKLCQALPGVEMHYAIKSLPNLAVLRTLKQAGAGFDIATSGEIELLRQVRANPRTTIHTHPIKKDRDIRDALRFGCTTFVVDNEAELAKFKPYGHRVGLLLRVCFRSGDAVVDLSKKFGCSLNEVASMRAAAAKLGLHVKGLSFHVGSQCGSSQAHVEAVRACNAMLRQPPLLGQAPMSILDIGGGFPVDYGKGKVDIKSFCKPVRAALRELPGHVQVIAEPGRFISAPAIMTVASVVGKAMRQERRWYYLDEGVYGSFSGQIYDHARYPLTPLQTRGPLFPSVLAGPTCDSIDVIAEEIGLPEMEVGDLIIGRMMGAYTVASATMFNSLPLTRIITLNEPEAEADKISWIG